MLVHAHNKSKAVVQAFAFGKYLGKLRVTFGEKGDLESWSGNPILLSDMIQENEQTAKDVEQWQKKVDEMAEVETYP